LTRALDYLGWRTAHLWPHSLTHSTILLLYPLSFASPPTQLCFPIFTHSAILLHPLSSASSPTQLYFFTHSTFPLPHIQNSRTCVLTHSTITHLSPASSSLPYHTSAMVAVGQHAPGSHAAGRPRGGGGGGGGGGRRPGQLARHHYVEFEIDWDLFVDFCECARHTKRILTNWYGIRRVNITIEGMSEVQLLATAAWKQCQARPAIERLHQDYDHAKLVHSRPLELRAHPSGRPIQWSDLVRSSANGQTIEPAQFQPTKMSAVILQHGRGAFLARHPCERCRTGGGRLSTCRRFLWRANDTDELTDEHRGACLNCWADGVQCH
jgi:hypothetical protein